MLPPALLGARMTMAADDLAAMMADTALTVPVVSGASSLRGYFDWRQMIEKDAAGFDVFVNRRTVAVAAGSLTVPARGASITVDGATYTVHDTTRDADGAVLIIVLAS